MGEEEKAPPLCNADEERLLEIVREELESTLRTVVREELDGAVESFTESFYANVGRSLIRRFIIIVGLVVVYGAIKFGVIQIPGIK